jgi:hypothetical protein
MGVEAGMEYGLQNLLPYAYSGANNDGGPDEADSIDEDGMPVAPMPRAAVGYIEMIEMGTMNGGDAVSTNELSAAIGVAHPSRKSSAWAATHTIKTVEDDDGEEMTVIEPNDCEMLVENWTEYTGTGVAAKPHALSGWWLDVAEANCPADWDEDDLGVDSCGQIDFLCFSASDTEDYDSVDRCLTSTVANSGGLFGGASIINVGKGTMFSYDARALQGFDETTDGIHFYPGTIYPNLNSGDENQAFVFTGFGNVELLSYGRGIDAVSAVFMHDELANTYVVEEQINAATEWVFTFPTKAWYVDGDILGDVSYYEPDPDDAGCNGWTPGEDNPYVAEDNPGLDDDWKLGDDPPPPIGDEDTWEFCTPVKVVLPADERNPFTERFDGEACEPVTLRIWDREESPVAPGGEIIPPIVSPAPPTTPGDPEAPFDLCYEVNVLRFGEVSVFGGGLEEEDEGLTKTVELPDDHVSGWARVTFAGSDGSSSCVACGSKSAGYPELHVDDAGMRGLPVTGFNAEQYTNGELEGGVLANYGGLFSHKGSVRCDASNAGVELRPGTDDDCASSEGDVD